MPDNRKSSESNDETGQAMGINMIWIIASIVLVLWGIMVMCLLVFGARTEDRMINNEEMESNEED